MKEQDYAEFKKILLDWTVKIANAIIDGTRSAEDAKSLRFNLAHYIEELSKSTLRIKKVEEKLEMFSSFAIKELGSYVHFPMDIRWTLGRGTSQKDFEKWAYGGLGKALDKKVESILGENWQDKSMLSLGNKSMLKDSVDENSSILRDLLGE